MEISEEKANEMLQHPNNLPLDMPCLEWLGARNSKGYGVKLDCNPKIGERLAHRRAYYSAHGLIPPGKEVTHLCDNPPCYEITHLKLRTHAENMADMVKKNRHVTHNQVGIPKVTHCPQGHEFTPENTYDPSKFSAIHQKCKQCNREAGRRYREKKRMKRGNH